MAGQTIRGSKGLVIVRLCQAGILGIVAIQTQSGSVFGQVIIEFPFASLTGLMSYVTGFAAHVQGSVAAAIYRNVHALTMAGKTQVLIRGFSRGGL